jgi:G3E family GTPase
LIKADVSKDMAQVQVVLFSGFLGAGKTTLLKRILSWDTDMAGTVVLVNDFGKVGVDGVLLGEGGTQIVELATGCICCTLNIDLRTTLAKILEEVGPRRIFIEASGVADPTAVVSVVEEAQFADRLRLDRVVTVLDADDWSAREVFGTVFYRQLQAAHLILLNKIDLIDESDVGRVLREVHREIPGATVIPTIRCRIDPDSLWAAGGKRPLRPPPLSFFQPSPPPAAAGVSGPSNPKGPAAADRYVTFEFTSECPVDPKRFEDFVSGLPREVFRIKGPVRLGDRTALYNFVGGRGEWRQWNGDAETRLTFIGWDVRPEEVLPALEECLV